MTGYQRYESIEQTIDKVNKSFNDSKQIAFIQASLRSGKEIYQNGGHSTIKLTERVLNLKFDNRREITVENTGYHQTKPFYHMSNSVQARLISSFGSARYRIYSPVSSTQCKGDAYLHLARRMIVRLLRTNYSLVGVNKPFTRLEIQVIMKNLGLKTSLNFISKQKDKEMILHSIPSTVKTLVCLNKLQVIFPLLPSNILMR